MINGAETYKKIAEALPYEVQAALLAIRDDHLELDKIPTTVYIALHELMLITEYEDDSIVLSRAGKHLVDYCTC